MSKVYQWRQSAAIAEASEWIARLDRGLTAPEERALHEWLAADRANLASFLEVAQLYDKLDSMARLADLFPRPQPQRWRLRPPLAAAGVLILAALVGFAWIFTAPEVSDRTGAPSPVAAAISGEASYATAIGEHSTIDLPDGSQLTLNTNTLIRTLFTADARALFLERGEVHVQVAHDPRRPFNVYVAGTFVQAVGTEFNLRIAADQKVELLVSEGKVLVGLLDEHPPASEQARRAPIRSEKQPKLVTAGGLMVLGGTDEEIQQLEPEEIVVKLSWRAGNLVFRGESLAEAIDEIERYTTVEFVISDESLKQIRVAGLFKTGDVEGLLRTLRENFNVTHQRVGTDKIILASSAATAP